MKTIPFLLKALAFSLLFLLFNLSAVQAEGLSAVQPESQSSSVSQPFSQPICQSRSQPLPAPLSQPLAQNPTSKTDSLVEYQEWKHNLWLSGGTLLFYHSATLSYETGELFPLWQKRTGHHLRLQGGVGLWQASLFQANTGGMAQLKLVYLSPGENWHLEIDGGINSYFDQGVSPRNASYIGSLPTAFIGARRQNGLSRFSFRGGLGFPEILQVGIGYSLP